MLGLAEGVAFQHDPAVMQDNEAGDMVVVHELRGIPGGAAVLVVEIERVRGVWQRHHVGAVMYDIATIESGDVAETDDLLLGRPERLVARRR